MTTPTAVAASIVAISTLLLQCGEPQAPLTGVCGRLLGHDGKPMPMAHVHLARPQSCGSRTCTPRRRKLSGHKMARRSILVVDDDAGLA